ncbi:sel1 repeat family protein [Fuscovulum ytuae]|uniref:Sel1 repeat family protein n=1 Tax=Fuscovulum ytuae TaxID=3042299 RepID=A0ABY8Q284_9RHOB|nr:sel1 repeat family protein [Fuscovulum sp. YMD61]WGV14896.1 sel1 repeat family protein [Fuscovulum sp. YMD61]
MKSRALLLPLLLMPLAAQAAPDLGSAIETLRAGRAPEAAQMLLDLARAGDAEAQFNLGLLYAEGIGVPQNDRESLYWGWRARLSGVPAARALIEKLGEKATPALREELVARIEADLAPRIQSGDGRAMLERSVLRLDLLPKPDLEGGYVWQALSAALATPNAAAARDETMARIDPKNRLAAQDAAIATLRDLCAGGMAGHPLCATLP